MVGENPRPVEELTSDEYRRMLHEGELPPVPVKKSGEPSDALPNTEQPKKERELNEEVERQAKQEAEELKKAREEIERAHGSSTPPKVEPKFAEERVGFATKEKQSESKKENPNKQEAEDKRFNPKYDSPDFYERLGVTSGASLKDIQDAFEYAAKKTHPDRGGNIGEFKAFQKAFNILNNPNERANYDLSRPKEVPKTERPKSEQPKSEQKSNPETPKTEAPNQNNEPTKKKFSERFKAGVKRGAKAFGETWEAEEGKRKNREAEARAKRDAKEKAEREKIKQQAEIVKAAKEEEKKRKAEKTAKEAEAKAAAKQKEQEKREAAREAERIKQRERRESKKEKRGGSKRTERREEKQEEREESFAEKKPNPWEKWGEQSRVSEKYFEPTRLGAKSKEYINESLQNEIKDAKDELALKWFEENKYKLEARGIPINGLSQEAMIRLAMDPATGEFSKEVLVDLEKNKDLYEADLLKIDNAKALGTEFGKDKVSPESQFLMLNHLEKRTSDLYDQINKLESLGGKENRDRATELQKEVDNLFVARKELAEKATGRNLTKETLERVAEKLGHDSKEGYMKDKALVSQTELMVRVNKMNTLAESEFAALSPKERKKYADMSDFVNKWEAKGKKLGLSQEQIYALSASGYKIENMGKKGFFNLIPRFRNFFRAERKIISPDGKKVWMRKNEFFDNIVRPAEEKYKSNIKDEAQKELSRRWDQEETGAIISELAVTMDESVGGTEAAYKRLKENLIEEYREKPVREKTAKEQAQQDKEFGDKAKEKADVLGFLSAALKGEGKFADLTGDFDKDYRTLANISEDYGIGISPKALKGLDANSYSKAAKNRGGLISLFIELMLKNPYKKFMNTAA